jgi:hypothetical protein
MPNIVVAWTTSGFSTVEITDEEFEDLMFNGPGADDPLVAFKWLDDRAEGDLGSEAVSSFDGRERPTIESATWDDEDDSWN